MSGVSRRLPTIDAKKEGLGRPTIMDRTLAQRYGAPYVYLAAFAIDVDRVREHLEDEGLDEDLPMGWEVFLTERYLEGRLEGAGETERAMIDDIVLAIFDLPPSEEPVFGSQLPFAVWHAVERKVLPAELASTFRVWKTKPKELAADLDRLYAKAEESTRTIARRCLDAALEPPFAPPVREALEAMLAPAPA